MSIEVDCGKITNFEGKHFRVFAHVCEEFQHQLDFVTLKFGNLTTFQGKPSEATSPLQQQAVAHAQLQVSELIWDDEVIED